MYISDDVLFSDSPLTLFNEISHDGPRSFVQDVAVWDGVLESSMVRDLYRAGRYSQASASANVATTTESIIRHSELLVEFLSASSPDIVQVIAWHSLVWCVFNL
jgi:hypothetical protein